MRTPGPAAPTRHDVFPTTLSLLRGPAETRPDCALAAPLRPLALADRPRFERAFARTGGSLADHGFASTWIWHDVLHLEWAAWHGHLLVMATSEREVTLLLPPLVDADADPAEVDLGAALALADTWLRGRGQAGLCIENCDSAAVERLLTARPGLDLERGADDYVYDNARLGALEGKSLRSKRHGRDRLLRTYPDAALLPLRAEDREQAIALLDRWNAGVEAREQDADADASVDAEARAEAAWMRRREVLANRAALDTADALGLLGFGLWLDGEARSQLAAFSLWEALPDGTVAALIEKADSEVPGAAAAIFSLGAGVLAPRFERCNAGDDGGLPGLRASKETWRPVELRSRWRVTARC